MKTQYIHTNFGEIIKSDVDLWCANAATADDAVLADLLQMNQTSLVEKDGEYLQNTDRGVIPYAPTAPLRNTDQTPMFDTSLVASDASGGGVCINAMRVVVGDRTKCLMSVPNRFTWRNINSGVFAGKRVDLANSGVFRWDLICLKFTWFLPTGAVSTHIKDPSTGNITEQSVPHGYYNKVESHVVAGEELSNDWPEVPADEKVSSYDGMYNVYYVPLAYVAIQPGFTSGTVVKSRNIYEVANVLSLSNATGSRTLAPANHQYKTGGSVLTNTQPMCDFVTVGSIKPPAFLPSTIRGSETRLIALDFTSSPHSHLTGDIVDDSIDWRNRVFKWQFQVAGTITYEQPPTFPWHADLANDGSADIVSASLSTLYSPDMNASRLNGFGMSNSFLRGAANPTVLQIRTSDNFYVGDNNAAVGIECDATTGRLRLTTEPTLTSKVFIWLEASGQFNNSYG